ncbi:MAG: hypothetical protein DMF45_13020 [Verrucomicrobia bacterium]|nr:MAG: hypothetical protein DMF45_13020 [Verrucomicrobiota bacterium]
MIVCADDYGCSDDANRAIVELVAARRVSAVSCMAGLPHCAPDNLKPLLEHADHIDVGLHFTVTARFLDGARFQRSVPVRLVNFFSALKSCVLLHAPRQNSGARSLVLEKRFDFHARETIPSAARGQRLGDQRRFCRRLQLSALAPIPRLSAPIHDAHGVADWNSHGAPRLR